MRNTHATSFNKMNVSLRPIPRNKKVFSFSARIQPIILNIVSVLDITDKAKVEALIRENFSFLQKVYERGPLFTIKYIKESRNLVLRYLGGDPLLSSELVEINKGMSAGFPKWLTAWLPLIDKTNPQQIWHLRILMTILVSMRHFKTEKSLDLTTIENKSLADVGNITDIDILRALRNLNVRIREDFPEWSCYHPSVKKGPSGPALLTSVAELTSYPSELIENIRLLGGSGLSSKLTDLLDQLDITKWESVASVLRRYFPVKAVLLRKISYFSDKEGKTRVIALLDYWSQTCLRPLHDELNSILRRIKTDCTYDQGRFTQILPKFDGSVTYHSIDLSAATDRMPLALQKRVLAILFSNPRKADAWASILVGHPFKAVLPNKSVRTDILYKAGQPMGAYSSWPAMALTHHIIVQVAAHRSGFRRFNDYCILGDDLVIANNSVAANYKRLLEILDMPFSPMKTHTSSMLFEFAKRWFYQGQEITGFSVGGYLTTWKKYSLLSMFLQNQESHGWIFHSYEAVRTLILHNQRILQGKAFILERFNRTYSLFMVFDQLVRFKMNPTKERGELFVNTLVSNFPTLHSSWIDLLNADPYQGLRTLIIQSKMSLANKDLSKFQVDLYKFNNILNRMVDSEIARTWAGTSPETVSFLKETLSVMLNWSTPVVHVLNNLIDKSIDYLTNTYLCDQDIGPDFDLIVNEGLGKYMITKRMFSMKPDDSKTLSEAAIVKTILEVGSKPKGETPDMILCASPPETISRGPTLAQLRRLIKSPVLLRYFDFTSGCFFMFMLLYLTGLLLSPGAADIIVPHYGVPPVIEFIQELEGDLYINSDSIPDTNPYGSDLGAAVFICYSVGVLLLLISGNDIVPEPLCQDLIDLSTPVSGSFPI